MNYEEIGLNLGKAAIIEYVKITSKKILKHIPMNLHEYTDHGIKHCENIEDYFELFIKIGHIDLTDDEKLLIGLAIWTHDLGNILDRDSHERFSVEILTDSVAYSSLEDSIGAQLFKALQIVIISHRSDFDLNSISEVPIHPNVNLKMVCAVFRLLDGCDITKARISNALYEVLNKYRPLSAISEKNWESHQNIIGVMFLDKKIILIIKDYEKAKLLTEDFIKNLDTINKIFEENGFSGLSVEHKNEDEYIIK